MSDAHDPLFTALTSTEEDPRPIERQAADFVMAVCSNQSGGTSAAAALSMACRTTTGPLALELREAHAGAATTSDLVTALRAIAYKRRSPLLTTLADLMASDPTLLPTDYLTPIAASTAAASLQRTAQEVIDGLTLDPSKMGPNQ